MNVTQDYQLYCPKTKIRLNYSNIINAFLPFFSLITTSSVTISILQQLVREYLATCGVVKTFRDEHVELGGAEITLVEMDV